MPPHDQSQLCDGISHCTATGSPRFYLPIYFLECTARIYVEIRKGRSSRCPISVRRNMSLIQPLKPQDVQGCNSPFCLLYLEVDFICVLPQSLEPYINAQSGQKRTMFTARADPQSDDQEAVVLSVKSCQKDIEEIGIAKTEGPLIDSTIIRCRAIPSVVDVNIQLHLKVIRLLISSRLSSDYSTSNNDYHFFL